MALFTHYIVTNGQEYKYYKKSNNTVMYEQMLTKEEAEEKALKLNIDIKQENF